jgi:hypothetical protein
LSIIIGTTRVARLLQFFQTRVRRAQDTDLQIADLSDTIEVAGALELSDRFLELPLEVRCTYSRAPVPSRGNSIAVLGRWGERHATEGTVDGRDVTAGLTGRDSLLLFEDRSRLATLYLWLAQRFPGVYVDGEAITRVRERLDDDIHDASYHAALGRNASANQGRPCGAKGRRNSIGADCPSSARRRSREIAKNCSHRQRTRRRAIS